MSEPIRIWRADTFALEMSDTGRTDWRGQSVLSYTFTDRGEIIFQGEDFSGSPLHADDSDETIGSLLGFLSLCEGDTDSEYFDNYSARQIDWRDERAEELSLYALELEGQLG